MSCLKLLQRIYTPLQVSKRHFSGLYTYRCMSSLRTAANDNKCELFDNERHGLPPKQNEQEFLVRLRSNPDTFGGPVEEELIDEGDLEEAKFLEDQPAPSQRLRTKQYADIIKEFIRKRKIKEALDVLEVKMLKDDRVKPESYIYNLLMGACGRVGYTKKAFMLYNQMKKRAMKATGGTYTALFNACANSPWPADGLKRATHLRNIMIEKMDEPNDSNYNAMIKAFGRCGDLPTAFSIVDEMAAKGFKIKSDTINFLLQACISDSEAGFRHALLVWRKVINKRIAPNLFTFNLMLRSIRDCGIGDVEVTRDVIDKILKETPLQLKGKPQKLIGDGEVTHTSEIAPMTDLRPNLMAIQPHLGSIISLSEIIRAEDRLLLVGGQKGFLKSMEDHGCSPDVKTFTQLLDCLPGNVAAEKELITAMKNVSVKPDLDFYNMLIKKRSMRFDYEAAQDVLKLIKKAGYKPNLITYGVLALGCKTKDEALTLLQEMEAHSYRLNTEILGTMLRQACHHKNFPYVLEIMEISLRENVNPNKMFMECLATFKKTCKYISNNKDQELYHNKTFQKEFRIFQMRYKTWLEQVEVDTTEDEHPWTQYRQTTDTDVRHYKDKSVRFKARHISKFKVKTSTKPT